MDTLQDTALKATSGPSVQILQTVFLLILTTTILNNDLNLILAVSICSAWLTHSITQSDSSLTQSLLSQYAVRAEERRKHRRDVLGQIVEEFVAEIAMNKEPEREMRDVGSQTDIVTVDDNERNDEREQEPTIESIEEDVKEESVVSVIEEPESESVTESVTVSEPESDFLARSPSISTVHSQASVQIQTHLPVQASAPAPWISLIPIKYEPLRESSCIGARVDGQRCGQSFISNADKQQAHFILQKMRSQDPGDTFEFNSLLQLANCMLCPRWHRDRKPQGERFARQWYSQLEPARRALQQYQTSYASPSWALNPTTPPSSSFGWTNTNSNARNQSYYSPQTPVYSSIASPSPQLQLAFDSPYIGTPQSPFGLSLDGSLTATTNKSVNRNLRPQFESMRSGPS